MKIRIDHLAASAAIVLSLASANAASAQQPAASAAQASPLSGPPIPGACVFSRDGAMASSKLGRYIGQRLQTLEQQANAELNATRTSLVNDANALKAQQPTLNQQQLEQKQLELQQRDRALQQLIEKRNQELQITEQKAFARWMTETAPLFELTARERNCSLVFDGGGVYAVAPAMDMTRDVVQKLDAKITEFTFERANYEQELAALQAAQGAQAGATPGATPARPAATPARPATRR
jgi:Skp family chaperone for outer membrane proteins